jgi:hypothetical protein
MYLSDLSSSCEGISGGRGESVMTSNTSNMAISTRGEMVRRKCRRCMEFFLDKGGSCSYYSESIGDSEVSLRFNHLLRPWVPNEIP